jgi:hypothetical protein
MHAKDQAAPLHHFQAMVIAVGCIHSTAGLKSLDVVALLLSWLQQEKKWILIFDNLDAISVAEGVLAQTTWDGHTIITTRNPNAAAIPWKD